MKFYYCAMRELFLARFPMSCEIYLVDVCVSSNNTSINFRVTVQQFRDIIASKWKLPILHNSKKHVNIHLDWRLNLNKIHFKFIETDLWLLSLLIATNNESSTLIKNSTSLLKWNKFYIHESMMTWLFFMFSITKLF